MYEWTDGLRREVGGMSVGKSEPPGLADIVAGRPDDVFERWVRAASPVLFRTVRARYPQLDAGELVQETLLRGWRRRTTYRPDRGTPTTWLLAILVDQCRQHHRRRRVLTMPLTSELIITLAPDEPDVDLAEAISLLPKKQRGAIDCFYLIGLSVAESAAVLGCSEGTIKLNLADARRSLRWSLENSHG